MKRQVVTRGAVVILVALLIGSIALFACAAPKTTPAPAPAPTPAPAPATTPAPAPKPTATPAPAAQKFTIIYQNLWPNTSMTAYAYGEPVMNKIEERSGGRITFKRFYNAELVSQDRALDACAKGTIDWFFAPGTYYESIVPEGDNDLMYYNYPSQSSAALFLDLPQVQKIYQDAYAKTGTLVLSSWAHTEQVLMTVKKPVNTLADLKGLKIRGSGGSSNTALEALGATVVQLAAGDLPTALKLGTVDGCSQSHNFIWLGKYYEFIKYIMLPPTIPTQIEHNFFNPAKWQQLGPELQKLIMDTWREQAFWYAVQSVRESESIMSLAKAKGVTYIVLPPAELDKAKALVDPIKQKWAARSPASAQLYQLQKKWEQMDYTKVKMD